MKSNNTENFHNEKIVDNFLDVLCMNYDFSINNVKTSKNVVEKQVNEFEEYEEALNFYKNEFKKVNENKVNPDMKEEKRMYNIPVDEMD